MYARVNVHPCARIQFCAYMYVCVCLIEINKFCRYGPIDGIHKEDHSRLIEVKMVRPCILIISAHVVITVHKSLVHANTHRILASCICRVWSNIFAAAVMDSDRWIGESMMEDTVHPKSVSVSLSIIPFANMLIGTFL